MIRLLAGAACLWFMASAGVDPATKYRTMAGNERAAHLRVDDQTVTAVESAIAHGYRLIDTAAAYANERQVGEGMRQSGISRDDMFIETKVWISDYGYEATLHAFDKSAGKIGVDRLDLLLLHQPLPSRFELTLDAYHALEKLLADGKGARLA